MKESKQMEKQFELKKHVNAIHCSNNLSLVQRKLFNALLFNAYSDLPYKAKFTVPSRELCQLIGYNSNDYGKLKKALLGLITILLQWNIIDSATGKEKKWQASSILASAEMFDGFCHYEYSQVMKDFLYQPEIYGRLNIDLVAKFKSTYGLALYENCIRYQGLPQTPWFPVDIFRELMGVFGEKYNSFKDFKKRVLDIAIGEVNAISSLHIIPEIERINQKVTKIRFKLAKQHDTSQDALLESENNKFITTLKETFSMSQSTIDSLLSQYGETYLQEKVDIIIASESFVAGKIRGLSGYLIDCLKKDYKPSKSSKAIVEKFHEKRKSEGRAKIEKEDLQKKQYDNYVSSKIKKYIDSLSEGSHQQLIAMFDQYINSGKKQMLVKWYKSSGFDHPAVRGEFQWFVRKEKGADIGAIMSEDEFKNIINECNQ